MPADATWRRRAAITISRRTTIALWLICEVAIAACDLAEVIGAAIALNLLFGLPMIWGVCLTSADVLIVLLLQHYRFRYVEAIVVLLIVGIAGSFAIELWLARPDLTGVVQGMWPSTEIVRDPHMLYIAVGILGATVMPHNLYLHSSIVQTRKYGDDVKSRKEAVGFSVIDSTVALMSALFLNGAILVMAAATFHGTGHQNVADISDAYLLLAPLLGTHLAATLFAVALLFSGQNATLTGTLAGQIVMEGFLNIRLRPWLRRLITRLIAIIPALITVAHLRRPGQRVAAGAEPGDPEPAAAVRRVPAGDVHGRSAEDGRPRRAALDARARLAGGDPDRGAQRVAVVANVLRLDHVYAHSRRHRELTGGSDGDRARARAGDADQGVAAARARR